MQLQVWRVYIGMGGWFGVGMTGGIHWNTQSDSRADADQPRIPANSAP